MVFKVNFFKGYAELPAHVFPAHTFPARFFFGPEVLLFSGPFE
jgi:hypothetical protein